MDPSLLMTVLSQGEEEARKLKAQLNEPVDVESCKSLARNVQLSFEAAISMARNMTGRSSSPQSGGSESPRSENWEEEGAICKKRKGLPKWSNQVRASFGGGVENLLDDGFSWRKYGQKDILGAKYPRGYYRCTHRNTQGCLATKQVQRSDNDPLIFDVSYRGTHTCLEKPQKSQASPKPTQQNLMSLRESHRVKTEGLESNIDRTNVVSSSSFSFPLAPASCMQSQSNVFLSPSEFSPNFMYSSSNYVGQTSNNGGGMNVHDSGTELAEIVSAATSMTNYPMVDIDFGNFYPGDFDPNSPFDNSNFF